MHGGTIEVKHIPTEFLITLQKIYRLKTTDLNFDFFSPMLFLIC